LELTPPTHPDVHNLKNALEKFEDVAKAVNEAIRSNEQMKKVIEIQYMFDPPLKDNLVEPSRRFIFQGKLTKITSRFVREVVYICFNDILVYAYETLSSSLTTKSTPDLAQNTTLSYKGTIELGPCWIRNLEDTRDVKNAFQIVAPKKTYTVYAKDLAYKTEWVNILTKTIESLVAKNPGLTGKRATVKHTKRNNPIYNVLTYKVDQFDPDAAKDVEKDVEKKPLLSESSPKSEEEPCCSCSII